MEIFDYVNSICDAACASKAALAVAKTNIKNEALRAIAKSLRAHCDMILEANREDLADAGKNGVPDVMLDRLRLDEGRISGIADSLDVLISLPDYIGSGDCRICPNGMRISHIRVPLGVVAVIYEARPNVTVDIAALCIKTGNAIVLRGGREAIHTNKVLVSLMREAIAECGLPSDAIQLIERTEREGADALMSMRGKVDLLIPRGGRGLIRSVSEKSKVPVIETGAGNCHVYIDASADIGMALRVTENAKMSRPAVCNSAETLLVHKDIAGEFLPEFEKLTHGKLELRGCDKTLAILPGIKRASDEDFDTEYDDYIMSVKVVSSIDEAIAHINLHSTHHSEAIITRSLENAEKFKSEVDSAAVYVNASTRFTDGGEFGLGAEVGISTQKLHARGPMGLLALTSEKYLIDGNGQIR